MAVRRFNFTAGINTISHSSIAGAGVQGEHNATELVFSLDNELINQLINLKREKENRTFCYRFDGYDGAGGKESTPATEFMPSEINFETKFIYSLEHWLTRYGGEIQVFFIISCYDYDAENETEMELYSYSVKLRLKSIPEGKEIIGENYESVSVLSEVAKESAKIASDCKAAALEAQGKTEFAKAALEGETLWIFDGGTASSAADIKFVIDNEMSDTSENPIKNRVVKKYVDDTVKAVNEKAEENTEKITEADERLKEIEERHEKEVRYPIETGKIKQDDTITWKYIKYSDGIVEIQGTKYIGTIELLDSYQWGNLYFCSCEIEFPQNLFATAPEFFSIKTISPSGLINHSITSISEKNVNMYITDSRAGVSYNVKLNMKFEGRMKEEG